MFSYNGLNIHLYQNQWRHVCFLEFARWRHQLDVRWCSLVECARWRHRRRSRRSLLSLSAFWFIFTARRYASAVYAAIVCPSARPSITRLYCIKTAKHTVTQTMPYNNPGTPVFWC